MSTSTTVNIRPVRGHEYNPDVVYTKVPGRGGGRNIDWGAVSPEKMKVVNGYLRQYTPMVRGATINILKQFPHADWDEVYSQGMMALARCALRFDPKRGYAFTTYSMASVYRSCHRIGKLSVVPLKRDIQGETITRNTDLPPQPATLADIIQSEDRDAALKWLLGTLLQMDRRVSLAVRARYIDDHKLSTIGDMLGVTKERARQIIDGGMRQLVGWWKKEQARKLAIEEGMIT